MLAELLTDGITQIIILSMTPIILALIPLIFKGRRDAKKRVETVESAAETMHSTGKAQLEVLSMMENSFIHIGELRGDIREIHESLKELTDEFHQHTKEDEAFMNRAFGFMAKTEPKIEEIKQTVVNSSESQQLDRELLEQRQAS